MSQFSSCVAWATSWGGSWTLRARKTRWLGGLLVGTFLCYLIIMFYVDQNSGKGHPFGDFFALWSYAKIELSRPAPELYNFGTLHQAQVAMGMPANQQNPFPYPPSFLLLLWPLGFLPFYPAYVVWAGGTLLTYLIATCAGGRCKAAMVAALLLAPTTVICLVSGQSGFLVAALLVGGLQLVTHRPILAGILFGLLTYKPQFGMLVPVALVAAGQWRCIAATCATAAALIIATAAVFGSSVWVTWLEALPVYAAWFDRLTVASQHMPTVLTNLQMLGLPQDVARAGQIAAAAVAAILVWNTWRRPTHSLGVPVVLAATCLATPHAFIYDLPVLSSAVVLFAAHRLRSTASLFSSEIGVLVFALTFPVIMTLRGVHAPISTVAISLFLTLIFAPGKAMDRRMQDIGATAQTRAAG
jgi:hypothetical protein